MSKKLKCRYEYKHFKKIRERNDPHFRFLTNGTPFFSDLGYCKVLRTCNKRPLEPKYLFPRFLLQTGTRIGEAANVRVCDIDPLNYVIYLPKTKTVPRYIRASPELQPYLNLYILKKGPSTKLFRYHKRHLELLWKLVLEEAGVPHVGTHTARRTFITWELNLHRLREMEIAKQVGHVKLNTMYEYYYQMMAEAIYGGKITHEWTTVALQGLPSPRERDVQAGVVQGRKDAS